VTEPSHHLGDTLTQGDAAERARFSHVAGERGEVEQPWTQPLFSWRWSVRLGGGAPEDTAAESRRERQRRTVQKKAEPPKRGREGC